MISSENKQLAVYSCGHFCMDFLCCFLLMKYTVNGLLLLAGYHGLAFALQPVFGSFCDRYPKFPGGKISAILIAAAYLVSGYSITGAVLLAGIANAFFHLEGGYASMHRRDHKLTPLGVFVAPGALGIAMGKVLGYGSWSMVTAFLSAGIVLTLCMFLCPVTEKIRTARQYYAVNRKNTAVFGFVLSSVVIRSYAGFIMPVYEFSGNGRILAIAFTAFLGKMAGGMIADRFGVYRTAVISQMLGILSVLSLYFPVSLVFVFLINVPMAITLACLNDCMPEDTGMAFGTAPLGLFIGFLLSLSVRLPEGWGIYVCSALMVLCGFFMMKTLEKDL